MRYTYQHPDFDAPALRAAPLTRFAPCPADGVAPGGYHATSIFPEYLHVEQGRWVLLERSRMDCVIRQNPDGTLEVVEFRRLKAGDLVALGRGEHAEEGILVHPAGFSASASDEETGPDATPRAPTSPPCGRCGDASVPASAVPPGSRASTQEQPFAFRTGISRETSFSIDYDTLYEILRHDRENGFIVWVAGPAVVFDADARNAFASLVEQGYVHALLAGNALATHDMEGALYGTALGQGIYHKRQAPMGHYHHLDCINAVREAGGIAAAVRSGLIRDGVMHAVVKYGVPFVLAGSIRDDGPLPDVIPDVYDAQDAMRQLVSRATTVVALATQLHTIATGNMTPSYQVLEDGGVRPVHFFVVDMSEFAAGKLADRGSLSARAILTNVQDFVVNVTRALSPSKPLPRTQENACPKGAEPAK
ncbi:MAG TPA: hypothetical protein DEF41_02585 [Desulfovibrio sp.]|nr:hypothetical protein [Desulfovibrio sp.]